MTEPSALELIERRLNESGTGEMGLLDTIHAVAAMVRAIRAAPAPEPVAWQWRHSEGWADIPQGKARAEALLESGYDVRPLFAAPVPQPEGPQALEKLATHLTEAIAYCISLDSLEEQCRHVIKELERLAALPSSPAPSGTSHHSSGRLPPATAAGAGEAISPADLAEVLENVRVGIAAIQGTVPGRGVPIELHKACQALTHMMKDSHS